MEPELIFKKKEKPDALGIELSCKHCGHNWKYKGSNKWVCTCPHCRTSVMVKNKS